MTFKILKGNCSGKYFGWQLKWNGYTLQWSDNQLAIFNSKINEWTELL